MHGFLGTRTFGIFELGKGESQGTDFYMVCPGLSVQLIITLKLIFCFFIETDKNNFE